LKKILFLLVLASAVVVSCHQSTNNNVVKAQNVSVKRDITVKVYPLTDSGQLMLHLDSLPRAKFPYLGEDGSRTVSVSLVNFRNKELLHQPIKLIPVFIGASTLDHGGEVDENGVLPDSVKEFFDVVDPDTYKITGVVIATTPKFVVINLYHGTIVTLSYDVKVMDAIYGWEQEGNNHWTVSRGTTIKKDLSLLVEDYWNRPEAPKEAEHDQQHWFIDNTGHFQKKPGKVKIIH